MAMVMHNNRVLVLVKSNLFIKHIEKQLKVLYKRKQVYDTLHQRPRFSDKFILEINENLDLVCCHTKEVFLPLNNPVLPA